MEPNQSKTRLSSPAIAALHAGNKIEAIKLVRAESGLGLKEAKNLVDEYVSARPSLEADLAQTQAESMKKVVWWLIAIVACVVLGYVLLTKH